MNPEARGIQGRRAARLPWAAFIPEPHTAVRKLAKDKPR